MNSSAAAAKSSSNLGWAGLVFGVRVGRKAEAAQHTSVCRAAAECVHHGPERSGFERLRLAPSNHWFQRGGFVHADLVNLSCCRAIGRLRTVLPLAATIAT
jgi:hypothetical protein